MMDNEIRSSIQQRISKESYWVDSMHRVPGIPEDFRPWTCGLSPSALYSCSLKCRKSSGIKTPETKWMSIKRWVTSSHDGVELPPGTFFSVKRHEKFVAMPNPHFAKTEYILLMFPHGNTWSQVSPGVPITEDWLWTEDPEGFLMFERLLMRDAAQPLKGYFERVHKYMVDNPDQIGIHLKRKRKTDDPLSTTD
jgi:hypothetical protein